uniref:Uncharacterized protein MANES_05G152700 n=1 Tax=Rhizophora mucronata TaxID=61149 RepID=A0A2P2P2W7_RHIMU
MKIQCDVCNKEEAAVFCTADEAALCDGCDHCVHHVNKLASKHQRFSLVHPSTKSSPLCDVCQEKRAFLFCQQDRAILCRDCDVPIHTANQHTQKHNRFLLTGIKLSATPSFYVSSSVGGDSGDLVLDSKAQQQPPSIKKQQPATITPPKSNTPTSAVSKNLSSNKKVNQVQGDTNPAIMEEIGSTSSISEYLIETLPGWHVEDFLDSFSVPFSFSKPDDDGTMLFVGADLESNMVSFSSENTGICVPQAPTPSFPLPQIMGLQNGFKETKEAPASTKASRCWTDEIFAVPQISPPSTGFKRSRPF